MTLKSTFLALVALAAVTAGAAPVTFHIGKGSPAAQIAQVESVTDFETFTGRTSAVSGTINFDAAKRTGSGSIVIDAGSIDTGIAARNEHMRSAGWLDTEKYKTITFTTTKVQFVKGSTYKVTGKLTLHGVTKTVTTNVDVKHMKASQTTQKAGFKGDVLQVKTSFKVKLSDYGIAIPAIAKGKVAETVTLSVTTYAQSGS